MLQATQILKDNLTLDLVFGFKNINMKKLICLLCVFSLTTIHAFNSPNKRIDKEIKSAFELEIYSIELKLIDSELKSELTSNFWNNNFYEIKNEQELIGYAYIGEGFGKTDNFEYLLLFDVNLIIVKSKVLKYREDYGGEIGSKRWLKQLIGKSSKDRLLYGENIAAISGATLSVKSMTNSVNKVLESIAILQNKNIL